MRADDPPPTRAERWERGRSERERLPLAAHAELTPAADQDCVDLLIGQSASRVPELVPLRYRRMLVSPLAFYRGAALIMADDLGHAPRSTLTSQLCGDAHLGNFGVFASPERRLVFDLNDFDETHPGPFEWDVKRFAASLEVVGRDNGFTRRQRRAVVTSAAGVYRTTMREFSAATNLAVWYAHQEVRPGLPGLQSIRSKSTRRKVKKSLDKAMSRDHLGSLASLTETVDGGLRFVSDPPLVVPARELELPPQAVDRLDVWMSRLLDEYSRSLVRDRRLLMQQYEFVDIARKVGGVGSVGTRTWIVLLRGVDDDDPLLLQAKEATSSVLEAYTEPAAFRSHGERVVEGQRLMQAYGDILLGWHHSRRRVAPDYYLRQLRDWKGSLDGETLGPDDLELYASYCAWALARAHARSGDRLAIAGYLGSKPVFDAAIADFSAAYADKNERDFASLERAAADGRIAVSPDI